jgi:hypothetical protein
MIQAMKLRDWMSRLSVAVVLVWTMLSAPVLAADAEDKVVDARLEGYGRSVTLDGGSTALTWMLLILLGALCVGVMFKNANRSHLD